MAKGQMGNYALVYFREQKVNSMRNAKQIEVSLQLVGALVVLPRLHGTEYGSGPGAEAICAGNGTGDGNLYRRRGSGRGDGGFRRQQVPHGNGEGAQGMCGAGVNAGGIFSEGGDGVSASFYHMFE